MQMPERGLMLEIGKGPVMREGPDVALLSFGQYLPECLASAEALMAQGVSVTVADARFAKPLDTRLMDQLARHHRALITVEQGAGGGLEPRSCSTWPTQAGWTMGCGRGR